MGVFTKATPMPAEASRAGPMADAAAPGVQTGTIARTDLQPSPLPPAWILAGNPIARALPLGGAADGNFSFCLWDCTAGRFKFTHNRDEFVHILEGEVTILAAGAELHLRPGEVAFFPHGLTTDWTVHSYVKKLAVLRSTPRTLLARVVGKVEQVWRRILGPHSHRRTRAL